MTCFLEIYIHEENILKIQQCFDAKSNHSYIIQILWGQLRWKYRMFFLWLRWVVDNYAFIWNTTQINRFLCLLCLGSNWLSSHNRVSLTVEYSEWYVGAVIPFNFNIKKKLPSVFGFAEQSCFKPFSVGNVFRRQNLILTSKVDPHTDRIKPIIMAIDS